MHLLQWTSLYAVTNVIGVEILPLVDNETINSNNSNVEDQDVLCVGILGEDGAIVICPMIYLTP